MANKENYDTRRPSHMQSGYNSGKSEGNSGDYETDTLQTKEWMERWKEVTREDWRE